MLTLGSRLKIQDGRLKDNAQTEDGDLERTEGRERGRGDPSYRLGGGLAPLLQTNINKKTKPSRSEKRSSSLNRV